MQHPSTIFALCNGFTTRLSYISYSEASLSLAKKWIKNPWIDDAQSFKLATDHESIRSVNGSLCGRCRNVFVPLLFSC